MLLTLMPCASMPVCVAANDLPSAAFATCVVIITLPPFLPTKVQWFASAPLVYDRVSALGLPFTGLSLPSNM